MIINTSMSVYNKYINTTTKAITFKKHLIDNVFWDDSKGINLNKGYDNADNVNIFIPKSQNDMSKYVSPRNYLGGSEWTLQNGDFIVKGNTNLSSVSKISELNELYDNVFTITLVDDKDFGSDNMRHFEIRGR